MQFKKNDRVAHLADRIFYGTVIEMRNYNGYSQVIICWDGSTGNSTYAWPGSIFWEQTAKLCDGRTL